MAKQLDTVGATISEYDLVITTLSIVSEPYQFLIEAFEPVSYSLSYKTETSRLIPRDIKRKEEGVDVDGAAHD